MIPWQVCPGYKKGSDDAVARTQVMKGGCLESWSFYHEYGCADHIGPKEVGPDDKGPRFDA